MSDPDRWILALNALVERRDPRPLAKWTEELLRDRPSTVSVPIEFLALLGELLHPRCNLFDVKLVVQKATYAQTELRKVARHQPRIAAYLRHKKAGKTHEVAIDDAAAELGLNSWTVRESVKKYRPSFGISKTRKPSSKKKKPTRKPQLKRRTDNLR